MSSLRGMEKEFRLAIEKGEFHVWYQPQMDMRTGCRCGAEALVRWEKNGDRVLLPDMFVPVLEKLGLIVRLDEEVVKTVCRNIRQGKEEGFCLSPVSVNLSRLQASRNGIPEKLKKIAEKYGIEKGELLFEITETAENKEANLSEFVEQMRKNGFQIAMDDYGIGNSSLKVLQENCFDIMKLDRYFISRIGDPKIEIILSSTIAMAEKLGMKVVAEGVETEDQIRFLLGHKCYFAQGYYYLKPLKKEQYIRWMQLSDTAGTEQHPDERKRRI